MFLKTLTYVFLAVIATAFMYANMAEAQIVEKGLVSYWTLDKADIKDKVVKDVWSDNDGEINGKPEIVEGKIQEALEFDGSSDFVVASSVLEDFDLTQPYSLVSWLKFGDQAGFNSALGFEGGGQNIHLGREGNNWKMATMGQTPGNGSPISIDTWYHTVVVWDGKRFTLYVNGEEDYGVDSKDGGNFLSVLDTFMIGRSELRRWFFKGVADEVCIYNRALSKNEIQRNYKAEEIRFAVVNSARKLSLTWGEIKASR